MARDHYPSRETRDAVASVIGPSVLVDIVMQYATFRRPIDQWLPSTDFLCAQNGLWEECLAIVSSDEGAIGAVSGGHMQLLDYMLAKGGPACRQTRVTGLITLFCDDSTYGRQPERVSEILDHLLAGQSLAELLSMSARMSMPGGSHTMIAERVSRAITKASAGATFS